MRHFIAYHNTEKMGRRLHEGREVNDLLGVSTSKPVEKLLGNLVWFVTGEEFAPRRFSLASVFRVTETGDEEGNEFKHFASGPGHVFDPPIPLNDVVWFAKVRHVTGNFGLGVQEVNDAEVIAELRKLANAAGAAIA